jgi:hypothetical protein
MMKYLMIAIAPLIFLGLVVVSLTWFLAKKNERTVQDLARRCVNHGMTASWSVESRLLNSHVKFSCVAKASSAPTGFQKQ